MSNHRVQQLRRSSLGITRDAYDRQNFEAALIIISEADYYGGEEAGVVRWARLVLARLGSASISHAEAV